MGLNGRNKAQRHASKRNGLKRDVRSVKNIVVQSDQESFSADGESSTRHSDEIPVLENLGQGNEKTDLHRSFDGGMKNINHPVWNSDAPEFKPKSIEKIHETPAADVMIDLNLQELENKGKTVSGVCTDKLSTENIRRTLFIEETNLMHQLSVGKNSRTLKNMPNLSVTLERRNKIPDKQLAKSSSSEQMSIPRQSYTEKRDSARKEPVVICPDYEIEVIRREITKLTVVIPRGIQNKSAETIYLGSLETVAFFIDPLARNEEIDLLGMLDKVLTKRPVSPSSGFGDKENKAVSLITKAITKLGKMLSTIKYANLGFAAQNELQSDFPLSLLENNYDWEADTVLLTSLVGKLVACPLSTDDLKEEFDQANKDTLEILELIDKDDRVKLSEMNIQHKGTAQIRILHGLEVTDSELFEVVKLSVSTDYGNFLWMVENKPSLLLHSLDIADAVVSSIHRKMLSKDLRPLAALIWIVPKMLQSLIPEDLCTLSEKYVTNQEVKIGNWTEVLLFGYQMRWLKRNSGQLQTKCIIEAALADPTPVEDITSFLLFCALIAEFGEGRFARVYDFSTDAFCTRMGRVMASNIPIANKQKLLNSLMALPDPIKRRLLTDKGGNTATSLYYSADVIIMLQVEAATKVKALELLGEHISLVRVVNTSILPNFTGQKRMLVVAVLSNLVQLEVFRKQVLSSEKGTKLLDDITGLALEQYADPTNGKTPRYPFMKNLLNFVDDIVCRDEGNTHLAATIKELITSRNLAWYQNVALVAVCFPKSKNKVSPPRPSIEDTREDMEVITRILQSWPEEEELLKSAFESTVLDIRPVADQVLLTYSLMNSCMAEESRVKELEQYIADFTQRSFVPLQNKSKKRLSESEEVPIWFKEMMDNADVKASIKDAVVAVARRWKPYSKLCPSSPRTAGRQQKNRRARK